MKNLFKKIGITILPLALVIAIDQFTKNWARTLLEPIYFGSFKLQLVFNNGVLLGHFSDLPLNVKEVVLITIGTFVLTFYLLSLWLLPIRSRATYLGLSILVGGILGNVADRFNGFSVVDFLSMNILNRNLPYFNLADLSQWIGYIFIFIGLYRDSLYYWPKNDWRKKYLINPYFQIRSSLVIVLLTFCAGTIALVFSYGFLRHNQTQLTIKYFFTIGFFVSFTFSSFTFLVSLVLTHRVAGPIYAIQRHLKNIRNGQLVKFKLRENDEFKEIEEDLNQLGKEVYQITKIYPPPIPEHLRKKDTA